jgi:hypothetical protein
MDYIYILSPHRNIGSYTLLIFFLPLLICQKQGMFGMNVDILANNPSIKWYFIIAIPFTALVLIIAVLIRGRHWIKRNMIPTRNRTSSGEEGVVYKD